MPATTANPPLPFTKQAIRDHLRFHATNGPAYVQIQATKALARIIGLYDETKQHIQNTANTATQQTKSRFHGLTFNGFGVYAQPPQPDPEPDPQLDPQPDPDTEADDDEDPPNQTEDEIP